MKVLLVATNRLVTPIPVYPIGVDYVAAALGDRHDVRTLDLACDDAEVTLATTCREFQPDIVGFSIRNIDNTDVHAPQGFMLDIEHLPALIRGECSARIVLGGPGFSIFPQALMARLRADFGIVGPGERMAELLAAIERNEPALDGAIVSIPGVWVGNKPTQKVQPWTGRIVRVLASQKTLAHYLRWGGMLNVQTKRGCPFLCSYCTYPTIEGRKTRLFEPEAIAQEWADLVRAGAKFLFVTDAVFNSHPRHNLAVADAIALRGLGIPWGAFFAPMRPPRDYYRRLRDAGLSHVEFGTESLSPTMLRSYRKPFTVEHALAAHAEARAAGLHVAHYILLGGPGETIATAQETLDRCERIPDAVFFFFCGVRIYPTTRIHAIALCEGQVDAADDLVEPRFYTPAGLAQSALHDLVSNRARGRRHWVIGSGDAQMAANKKRMYQRGQVGPLWDRLVAI